MNTLDPTLHIMPEGKHMGKNLQQIWDEDPGYVVFLSQNNLNFIQKLKYKEFFERCPDIVTAAQEMTRKNQINESQPQAVRYPGGWRGW